MKRAITIFLTLALVLGSNIQAYSSFETIKEDKVVFDNVTYVTKKVIGTDFSQGIPQDWDSTSDLQLVDSGGIYGQSGCLTSTEEAIAVETYEAISSSIITGNRYLLTSSFNFSTNAHSRPLLNVIEYQEGGNKEFYLLKADSSGYFTTKEGVQLMPYSANIWYKVDIILDIVAQTYEIYVDEKVIQSKRPLPHTLSKINRVTPAKQFDGKKDGGASVTMDNVYLYELKKSIYEIENDNLKNSIVPLENFNSYTASVPSGWVGSSTISPDVIEEAYGTSVKISVDTTNKDAEMYKLGTYTGKRILISGEYRFSSRNHTRLLLPINQNADAAMGVEKYELAAISAHNNGKFRHHAENTDIMDYEINKWYKIDIYLDTVNQKYEVYINGEQVISPTEFAKTFRKINRVDAVKHWNGSNGSASAWFDNFSVSDLNPKNVMGQNNKYIMSQMSKNYHFHQELSEDFESYNNISEMSSWTFNDTTPQRLTEKDSAYGQSIGVGVSPTFGATEVYHDFPEALTGKVVIKGTFKFSNNNIHRKLLFTTLSSLGTDKVEQGTVTAHNNQNFVVGTDANSRLLTYNAGEWYDVLVFFDLESKYFDFYINGEKVIERQASNIAAIKRLFLVKHWDQANPTAGETLIDDIGVYTLSPTLMPNLSVSLYGKEVYSMSQLSANQVVKIKANNISGNQKVLAAVYHGTQLECVSVSEDNNLNEAVLTLPSDLSNRRMVTFIWTDFEALKPTIDALRFD